MGNKPQWKPVVLMVAVNLAVGAGNALIKKTLDGGTDHMIVATYRLAISTIFLAPVAYFWERNIRPKLTARVLCEHFVSALIGASLTQYAFLLGLSHTSATMACAFISMIPAITFIMSIVFRMQSFNLKTKVGSAKALGTLICLSGALSLSFYKGIPLANMHQQAKDHPVKKSADKWTTGSILLFTGCLLQSSWFLLQARINRRYPCSYSSTAILSFFGAIQSALLSLIKVRNLEPWILKGKFEICTLIYVGVVGQGMCTVGMLWSIRQKGPLFTAAFTPLMLIFAALLDFCILHQQIYLGSVLGVVVVIIGLYIFLWGKSKDPEEVVAMQNQEAEKGEDCNSVSQALPVTMNSKAGQK